MPSLISYARALSAAFQIQKKYKFQGLNIAIENPKGSVRSGKEPSGKPWSVTMPYDYGYVIGTTGKDGDEVDVFIGPDKQAKYVYIVHQNKTADVKSGYDEDKCMMGFKTANDAKKAYHSAYNNVNLFHSMTMLPIDEFRKKVFAGKDKIHAAAEEYGLERLSKRQYKTLPVAKLPKEPIPGIDYMESGGPGSGRHKLFFHGTTDSYIKSIKKNGLIPSGIDKNIYITDNVYDAHDEAHFTVHGNPYDLGEKKGVGGRPIILVLDGNHPSIKNASFKEDEDPKYNDSVKILNSHIPAKAIKGYIYAHPNLEKGAAVSEKAIRKSLLKLSDIHAGGPGSGRRPEFGELNKEEKLAEQRRKWQEEHEALKKKGLNKFGKPILSEKAQRAVANANPAGKEHQDLAEANEHTIHKSLKGSVKSKDNSPFDIIHTDSMGKKHGIEVKAVVTQKNDKITQKGDAIARKAAFAEANKLKGQHTVAVDYRTNPAKPDVYYRKGVGSFRLGNMEKVKGGFRGLKSYFP